MAREVLPVVGYAVGFYFGGPFGASIGGAIGGYIGGVVDPPDPIEGPRLTDLRVTASTYGTPIPLIYGPENRLAGNIIWTTGLIESRRTEESGGKGGGGQETVHYSYRVSVAIALGRGPVEGIKRIWANSKLLFDLDALSVPPPPPTTDVGMVVVANPWTLIQQGIPLPNAGVQDGGPFAVLRFYQGNGTQQVDPTIESYMGAGNAPAYIHTAYLVIQDLQLADYGNAMPNIEVDVVGQEAITVGGVVRDLCRRAGVTELSSSSLSPPLRGFTVASGGPAFNAIGPLMRAYNFDLAEQGGQLRCLLRRPTLSGVIPGGEMGARMASDGTAGERIRHTTQSALRMPQEVSVTYSDPDMDYQPNSQRAGRAAGSGENNVRIELPLVLSGSDARWVADRALREAWATRRSAVCTVSDRWVGLNPGHVVGMQVAGEIVPHRVIRISRGHDGVIEVEAAYDDPQHDGPGEIAAAPPNIPASPIQLPGVTRLVLMDMPILRNQDDNAGFYWAVGADSSGWRGADIQRSSDGGETYSTMSQVAVRSTIGDVATALPAGPTDIWDRGNVLTVVLYDADDELEGLPELSVLNGGNAAWLGPADGQGGEVLQFANATLVGPATYELTGLLRGRRGTEYAVDDHGADEVFVLLQANTLGRSDFGPADWDIERLYRPVSILTTPTGTPTQTFTNMGVGQAPLAPVHIRGVRDGANNLTISCIRRTRHQAPGLGRGSAPLGEQSEQYEVDILDGATVVRTISTTTPTVDYSAAEQTADGLTPGDLVDVVWYQLSAVRGRGFGGAATL